MRIFDSITRGQFLLSPFVISAARKNPKLVFVCGDHEYSGEATLPLFAKELEARYGFETQVLKSSPDQNGETDIPGLEALAGADLVVLYLRWRRLPPEQLELIDAYVKSGKPILALRTTSHAFNFPKDHPNAAWNRWAPDVFGAPPGWNVEGHSHYGHQATTKVTLNAALASDPLLTGVAQEFVVPSWLYNVLPNYPPHDVKTLLYGDAINPNKTAVRNPVAWTWINRYGAKSFYTSLGHPGDFAIESFQRLLVNVMFWQLDQKQPKKWKGAMKIEVPYRGIVKSN
jgi:type 1 glutamine amidotransferase